MSPGEQGIEGVAADASTRVGEILAEAERHARDVAEETARTAAAARRDAESAADRIADEAREDARDAARERAAQLAQIQAALTARGPAVLDGLEGEGLTRARLEALIEALVASAEDVMEEAEKGDPRPGRGAAGGEAASAETEPAEPEDDPVAVAEELAQPLAGATPDDEASGEASGNGDGNGAGEPHRYDGPLPDGAPLKRRPGRSRERDARFAALLLAVQGRDRRDVEAHLRSEYGFADVEPILDEVFGPARA